MTPLVTVAGTWGWDAEWRREGSLLSRHLKDRHGIVPFRVDGRLFHWTTDINGARVWRKLLPKRYRSNHRDWFAGAHGLCAFTFDRLAADQTFLLSHSHGLNVVLPAAALGLKIAVLVDYAGPVRHEFFTPDPDLLRELVGDDDRFEALPPAIQRTPIIELARANIGEWIHFYDPTWADKTQLLGQLFDSTFSLDKAHPRAENVPVRGAGHSGLLHDPQWFPWLDPALSIITRAHVRTRHDSRV